MRVLNLSEPVLFQFHEEKLCTNPKDSQGAMRHVSKLHFSLVNISEQNILMDGKKQAQVTLSFHIGQSSESMFLPDASDTDYGKVYGPEGFDASVIYKNPVKKNQIILKVPVKKMQTVCFAPKSTLSFCWEEMITRAPEGFSNLTLSFTNIPELAETSLSHAIYKQCVYAHIPQFSVSPSGGAPGDTVTLDWRVENAVSGAILPVGYDIFGGASASLNVNLDGRGHYYLNIQSPHGNVYQDLYTHLLPPVISQANLTADRNLSWEAHFASKAELLQGDGKSFVGLTGNCNIQADVSDVTLRFYGLYQVARRLALPPITEIVSFTLETCLFPSHKCLLLRWETIGLTHLSVRVWDGDYYVLSNEEKGCYEQVYSPEICPTFRLDYECQTKKGSLVLEAQDLRCQESSFLISDVQKADAGPDGEPECQGNAICLPDKGQGEGGLHVPIH